MSSSGVTCAPTSASAHPLISRTHLIVRFDQGRWVAIDNGSLNGLYVNNRRVPVVDIQDGQRINIGNPDGPALTFEVGRHQGSAGRPPLTTSIPIVNPPPGPRPPRAAPPGTHGQARPGPAQPPQPQRRQRGLPSPHAAQRAAAELPVASGPTPVGGSPRAPPQQAQHATGPQPPADLPATGTRRGAHGAGGRPRRR